MAVAEIDVVFVGRTGVGKSSLVNMVKGTPDGSQGAAKVSNDTPPCTTQTTSYPVMLEGGLQCQLWDTPGLDEAVANSDKSFLSWVLNKIRDRQSSQTRELKETLQGRTKQGTPILVWCIEASKVEVAAQWQLFFKVYVDYCERKAIPAVVVTQGPTMEPDQAEKKSRCAERLEGLGLGVKVPFTMVRKYHNPSLVVEYKDEESRALKDFIANLIRPSS